MLVLLAQQAAVMMAAAGASTAQVAPAVGATPVLGWNSWNFFKSKLDEQVMRTTADMMVSTGLAAKGYRFVNMDDTWAARDPKTGELYGQPEKFPAGIVALVKYVHSKNLSFGIYTDVGHKTCAKCPGTWGHESQDAATFAKWEVDLVKSDSCFTAVDPGPQPADGASCYSKYKIFGAALKATGRPIIHSIKGPCGRPPGTMNGTCSPPDASAISNLRRCAGDARDNWQSMLRILDDAAAVVQFSAPGFFADLDILEIGNGGLTAAEERSVMALWCAIKSPMLLGNDLGNMTVQTLEIVGNSALIAVNQDALGIAARRVGNTSTTQTWFGPLSGGRHVLVMLNVADTKATLTVPLKSLGLKQQKVKAADLWAAAGTLPHVFTKTVSAAVDPHGVAAFVLEDV